MPANPPAVIDTRVIYCAEQRDIASILHRLRKLPDGCIDLPVSRCVALQSETRAELANTG